MALSAVDRFILGQPLTCNIVVMYDSEGMHVAFNRRPGDEVMDVFRRLNDAKIVCDYSGLLSNKSLVTFFRVNPAVNINSLCDAVIADLKNLDVTVNDNRF